MSQTNRLPAPFGRLIDRSLPATFDFEGRTITGFKGDTIASALCANDQWMISRSFKYHRPRGAFSFSGLDANAYVQVLDQPNVRADQLPLTENLAASAQNVWGSFQRERGVTSSGATSTQFKKAVLSLRVTPQITPDDRIIMDLKVSKDSVGAERVNGVPTVDTKTVDTQVLVSHGETVVLGGNYERTQRNQVERVPFFSEIPVLGYLFRNNSQRDDKSELLVFVTPRVMKESLAVR